MHTAGAAIDQRSGIGRVFEKVQDRGACRFLPDQISEPIPPGQKKRMGIEESQHLAC